jgi:methylenetetrahydrofolate reductase (NADH)
VATITLSSLAQALTSGRLVVTAECLPARGADAIKGLSAALPSELDAIIVADNPDEIHGSAMATAAILAGEGRPSVLSLATRDRNRIALESDALGAAALDISAILCLSGDHQSLGLCPPAAGANDIDSIQLTQALKNLILNGIGFDGRNLNGRPKLLVGAIAHPYLQPMELNLLRLKKKIDAGADFLLTQAIFDLEGFSHWMDAVRSAGFDKRAAIIPSVLPLTSAARAKSLQQRKTYGPIGDDVIDRIGKSADPVEEGVTMASQLAAQLKQVSGIRGIHILSGGCESLAAEIVKRAELMT